MNFLWPGFLFALGMGILALYVYGKNKKAVLAGSILILSLSILIWVIYSLKSQFGFVIGVSLFIIGAAFLTRGLIKEKKEESPPATKQEDRETDEEES
jgi:Na+/proline symporter